jgi:peptidoglycan-associated lipoprotein
MNVRIRLFVPVFLCVVFFAIAGCGKKSAPPLTASETAAPVTNAPAPTAQITATPMVISAGDQVQLNWSTTNATSISIDDIGDVPSVGVKTVTPKASTTYHLVARGSGGTTDASVRVTVNSAPAVTVPTNSLDEEQSFKANVQDIFFDYDAADIRTDAQATLDKDASYLSSHPNVKVVIGGYCDERGSDEYNLALGQNRANIVQKALVTAGIAAGRIRVVSYGKEKPFCTDSNEECWQLNRRAGFTMDK